MTTPPTIDENAADQTLTTYRRAQDTFDVVLSAVGPHQWDEPSACPAWTVRDVVGHVVWGQHLLRHLATNQPYPSRTGAPGAEQPGQLVEAEPLGEWRRARTAAADELGPETLALPGPPRAGGTLRDFVHTLVIDTLAHAWDIAHPLGLDVDLPTDLIAATLPAAQAVPRVPTMFGPALPVPAQADPRTRWLAALGRRV